MDEDELLAIGRFAHLSGLSIHALRHYDDVDLLKPASVDGGSGYRRYRRRQVDTAKLIRRLRWMDLPVDEIREVIDADVEERERLLDRHKARLERQASILADRMSAVDRQLEETEMPASNIGCRPVQIKIVVSDFAKAKIFYEVAFGLTAQVTRRTQDEDVYGFMFGNYEGPDFFLLHLIGEVGDMDAPGPSTFGMLVDDLDVVHRRAIAAGATEAVAAVTPEGMPRCSAIKDPDGNWIWLYQG